MAVVDVTGMESYMQEIASETDRRFMKLVTEAITLALSPWSPGAISVYVVNGFSANDLVFETELLPKLPCALSLTHHQLSAHCLDDLLWSLADQAFEWFRYRRTLPVDDHIILGED